MTIAAPATSLWLDDNATVFSPAGGGTQVGYGNVAGTARIIDLGSDATPWHGVAAFEPSILDQGQHDEDYQLIVEGSTTADFTGAKQDLASWELRAINPQDLVALTNVYDATVYRYIRLKIVVSGTTPQIRLRAFVRSLADLDDYTLAELITLQATIANNIHHATTNLRAWMAGTINSGPFSDGRYPLSDGLGNTVYVPCPAKIAASAGGAGMDGVYYYTELSGVNIPEEVRVIRTAGYSQLGIGIGEYTVGTAMPSGPSLPAATRGTRYSANRRPCTLITRREVSVNALGGDETALNEAATLVYSADGTQSKIMVMDAGQIRIESYKNWEKINLDLFPAGTILAGNDIGLPTEATDPISGLPIGVTTKGLPITFYKQGDPHKNFEIDQYIIGPVIDIGGNQAGVRAPAFKRLWFVGRRTSNATYPTVALRITGDQRAMTRYELGITDHNGDGLELKDDSEKKDISLQCSEVRGGYCLAVRSTQQEVLPSSGPPTRWSATASPDEVRVRYVATACDRLYYGMDGVQASITHDCLVENLTPTTGYAVMVMTRKSEKWQGEVRGVTGRFMYVGTRADGYTTGGCHMHFADFTLIQLYNGNVYIANPKNLTGRIVINYSWTNNPDEANPLTDEASITVGSCRGYCNLSVELRRCLSPAGIDVGDETYYGPVRTGSDGSEEIETIGLSFDNQTLNVAVEMGAFEGTSQAPPNTLWALRLRAGVSSTINCAYLAGNIKILSGWQRGTINVPAAWVRSGASVTIDPLAQTEMLVHGPMDLAEVFAISWKFKGLKILSVNDFDGMGIEYNGSVWVPMAPVNVPYVSLKALGSPYNQVEIKRKGLALMNLSDAWTYSASGPDQTDAWQYHGGTIEPDWLPETDAFVGRIAAAATLADAPVPEFTDDMRLAADRFFHDLIAAGVYDSADMDASIVKSIWAKLGPDPYFGSVNMLFDDWPLTLHGGMGHTSTIGFGPSDSATGAYTEVKGWAANKHGTEKNNIAIIGGSEQLLESSDSDSLHGGPFFSYGVDTADNWRGTFHRLDGGNSVQLMASASLPAPPNDFSIEYRIGIAWTPGNATQSIFMYGGQPVQMTKTHINGDVENIYFGRSRVGTTQKYLPTSLSFGGIAAGTVTNAQAAAILRALNTLRNALKAL